MIVPARYAEFLFAENYKGEILTIQDICSMFEIGGKYISCKELSTGNINCTYQVNYIKEGVNKSYIAQRINDKVFTDPIRLMDNIVAVTDYVRENIKKKGLSSKRFVLRVFLTKDEGKPYYRDNTGGYWRVYRYISDSVTFDSTDDLKIIERTGEAFGRFQNCLDGFDASVLYPVIPGFHDTPARYKKFKEIIAADSLNRAASVKKETDRLLSFENKASFLQRYLEEGKLPLRVTHNDTKCNNVAFDKNTGEALAVLDLDTVMPGAVAYDFGDAIRFIANTCVEDDPDIENVKLSVEKYAAFTEGFLSEVGEKLTDFEKETLNLGVFTMTVELALRFLGDYIEGDKYFKTKYPGHNLDRARNQLALAEDVLKNERKLNEILAEYE